MKPYQIRSLFSGVLGLLFLTASSAWAAEDELRYISGYLEPEIYKKLEAVDIRDGVTGFRWVGPKLNFANYKKVLIEEIVLYPKPEPTPQVSKETLDQMVDYLTVKLVDKIGAVLQLSFDPGPDVVRMQAAITGIEITTEGMQPKEIVPVAAIFGGLKALSGTRDQDVVVFFEAKFLDSVTGELIGAIVRQIEGEQLEGKREKLEMKHLEKSLDQASSDGQAVLKEMKAAE